MHYAETMHKDLRMPCIEFVVKPTEEVFFGLFCAFVADFPMFVEHTIVSGSRAFIGDAVDAFCPGDALSDAGEKLFSLKDLIFESHLEAVLGEIGGQGSSNR
jgi:hypothetical protein